VDVSLPAPEAPRGTVHPVSQVMDEVTAIFADLGFAVAEGPDVESDDYNFTKLNIPPEHPARQMHDTFYMKPQADGSRPLLRTHTSPVQVRTMLARNELGMGARAMLADAFTNYKLVATLEEHSVLGGLGGGNCRTYWAGLRCSISTGVVNCWLKRSRSSPMTFCDHWLAPTASCGCGTPPRAPDRGASAVPSPPRVRRSAAMGHSWPRSGTARTRTRGTWGPCACSTPPRASW
jgi:hypothetical protein